MIPKLEICCCDLFSAQAAQAGGADRIELCVGLEVGGLTPDVALLKTVKLALEIPVYVLIRPRPGHFVYASDEKALISAQIEASKEAGADGIVFGALLENKEIDLPFVQQIKEAINPLPFTFHRAFDLVHHPEKSLTALIELGIETVLSSGQENTAKEGKKNLAKWNNQFGDAIHIMPGAGIHSRNLAELDAAIQAPYYHASAKKTIQNEKVNSSFLLKNPSFHSYFQTDKEEVKKLKAILAKARS